MRINGKRKGMILLMGAGPGDPGMLTVRASEALSRCDLVAFDEKVSPQILDIASENVERIPLHPATMPGDPAHRQTLSMLLRRAAQGDTVVRLYVGDPFADSRAVDDALFLRDAGAPFQIIPGISVTSAAGVASGVALFQPALSCSVFVTRGPYYFNPGMKHLHAEREDSSPIPNPVSQRPHKPGLTIRRSRKEPLPARVEGEFRIRLPEDIVAQNPIPLSSAPPAVNKETECSAREWERMAKAADTLILLEAERHLRSVREGLLFGGRAADEPVAVVASPRTASQVIVYTTIGKLVNDCLDKTLSPPVVVYVGDLVNLHSQLISADNLDTQEVDRPEPVAVSVQDDLDVPTTDDDDDW
jgi:siroheme synthase